MVRTAVSLLLVLSGLPRCEAQAGHTAERTRWIDDAGLFSTGFGQVTFVARDGHHLTARIYRSTGFDPARGPIWFVMHGTTRDVERYIRAAAPVAERYDALAIAIHFSKEAYPRTTDYTLAIERYAEIEHVFDLVRDSLHGQQTGYYLFGHSAGAQFTHRLLTFLPQPRVLGAVAANAGWYTMPTNDDPRVHSMPYGLFGGPVQPRALVGFFQTPFIILLGDQDTTTSADDNLVRGTPEAEAQGANRLERGRHYFAVARAQATSLRARFSWRLEIVPGAAHDAAQVIQSAGFLTFVPAAQSCTSSTAGEAAGLVITEILADPPAGSGGDANRDGVRDPGDDEFVELVNQGPKPVCLAGWTLGDANAPHRHIFPLGSALAPGQFLIVFGGGVPTGRFGGAQVQWAATGLSLQSAGDVLTLRSANGAIVRQVSWGNCAGAECADDHWAGDLGIGRSLTRSRTSGAPWRPHPEATGSYSPGFDP